MTRKKPAPKTAGTSQAGDNNPSSSEPNKAVLTGETAQIEQVDNTQLIEEAVATGRALIEQGTPKIEAAMAIYEKLAQLPQETVVQAFIDGATLTTKGALTYWYNCRRKLKKIRTLST